MRAGDDRPSTPSRRYEPRLIAYARQMLGGAHHDAEEVVQDAFVRALGALRADGREIALKPWLYTIVRNRALDSCAAPCARPTSSCTRPCCATPAPTRTSGQRADDLRDLVGDLKRLPERQRTALVAHELEGGSHE